MALDMLVFGFALLSEWTMQAVQFLFHKQVRRYKIIYGLYIARFVSKLGYIHKKDKHLANSQI